MRCLQRQRRRGITEADLFQGYGIEKEVLDGKG